MSEKRNPLFPKYTEGENAGFNGEPRPGGVAAYLGYLVGTVMRRTAAKDEARLEQAQALRREAARTQLSGASAQAFDIIQTVASMPHHGNRKSMDGFRDQTLPEGRAYSWFTTLQLGPDIDPAVADYRAPLLRTEHYPLLHISHPGGVTTIDPRNVLIAVNLPVQDGGYGEPSVELQFNQVPYDPESLYDKEGNWQYGHINGKFIPGATFELNASGEVVSTSLTSPVSTGLLPVEGEVETNLPQVMGYLLQQSQATLQAYKSLA